MALLTLVSMLLCAQASSPAPAIRADGYITNPTQAQLGKVNLPEVKSLAPLILSKAARFNEGGKAKPEWFDYRQPDIYIPNAAEGGDVVRLDYGVGTVFFNRSDGKLSCVLLDPNMLPESEPTLGEEQCKQLALDYYRFCGGKEQMAFLATKAVNDGRSYRFSVSPTAGGVPFWGGVGWVVDRGTGCIEQMVMPRRSTPIHGSTVPGVTPEQAKASMLEAIGRFGRYSRMVFKGPDLVLKVPKFSSVPNEMLPLHVDMERQGKAMLMYVARINDLDSWSEPNGVYLRGCQLYTDAHTGRTIYLVAVEDYADYTSAGRPTGNKLPFAWRFPRGSLSVVSGKKVIRVPLGEISPVSDPRLPLRGEQVTLMRGDTALSITFDRASGVVYVTSVGQQYYGKPNVPMLKVLRAIKPRQLVPFGRAAR